MINLKNVLPWLSTGLMVLLSACVVGDTSTGKQVDASSEQPAIDAMPGAPDSMPIPPADARPPLDEMVTITFSTEETGGEYAPDNIVATWVEDDQGNFVQTLDRRAENANRIRHLVAWSTASDGDLTDATTGATRANHNAAISLTWDMPDGMADGVYTIRMETADSNADDGNGATDNNQGTFTFDKNGTADVQTGLTDGGHSNVTIDYTGR